MLHLNLTEHPKKLLGLTLLAALIMTLWAQWPYLFDRYRVTEDVQHFYWMARFQEPDLFPVDYLRWNHRLVNLNILGLPVTLLPRSLGYGLLFYVGSFFINPIWLMKLLVFALMPLCVTVLFQFGWRRDGPLTAVGLSLLFTFFILASFQSISIATGLQRAFAIPLFILFINAMSRKRYWAAGLLIFVSLLFYFPNFPVAALAYGLSLITIRRPFKLRVNWTPARWLPLITGGLLSLAVVGWTLAVESTAELVPEAGPMLKNPLYQNGGATPLFLGSPLLGRAGLFDAGSDLINFLLLLTVGLLMVAVLGRAGIRKIPAVVWRIVAAGLLMYAASLFLIIAFSSSALYLPSRYTRSTLFIAAIYFVGLNWANFWREFPAWLKRNRNLTLFFAVLLGAALAAIVAFLPPNLPLRPVLLFFGLVLSGFATMLAGGAATWLTAFSRRSPQVKFGGATALALAALVAGGFYIRTLEPKPINPTPAERAVYEFAATLPKTAVFAGDPYVLNGVPPFARRSALFNAMNQKTIPTADFFNAYYAASTDVVFEFCRQYHVNYIIVDKSDFTPEYLARKEFLYRPHNDVIIDIVAGRTNFVLPAMPAIFTSAPLAVIACQNPAASG